MRVLVFLLLANAVTAQSGGGVRSLAEEEEGSAAAEEEVSGGGELRMRNLDTVLEDFQNHEINLPRAEPLIQEIVYMMEDQELDSLSESDLDKLGPDVQEVSEGGAPVAEDGRKDNLGIGGGEYFISRPATNQSAPVVLTDIHQVNVNRFSLGFVAELSQCFLEI